MIIAFSSLFMDICFPIEAWPNHGDIVPAGPVSIVCGGKGGNQAVAAVRTGAKVHMVGMVGDDDFGKKLTARLRSEGVATSGVGYSSNLPTGTVCVLIDHDGESTQIASPAANREASDDQIPDAVLKPGNFIMTGLNLPRENIKRLLTRARGTGCISVMNLSPIKDYNHEMAGLADINIMNDAELGALAAQLGLPPADARQIIRDVVRITGRDCIVTLGGDGVIALRASGEFYDLPPHPVERVVDTNGAGDCFMGTFTGALDQGLNWATALKRANIAAALSCTKPGAMDSYPYINDIDQALQSVQAA